MSQNTYVMTGVVRLSFPHLFTPYAFMPGAKEKYSTVILIDKKDTATINAINAAIDAAIEEGIAKKFNGRKPAKSTLHLPLQDGDIEKAELDEAYSGMYYLNASSIDKVEVVDRNCNPIVEPSMVKGGDYARISLNFYAYNAGANKGVSCGLGNVQFVRSGEKLGTGKRSAAKEFSKLDDEIL